MDLDFLDFFLLGLFPIEMGHYLHQLSRHYQKSQQNETFYFLMIELGTSQRLSENYLKAPKLKLSEILFKPNHYAATGQV